MLDFGIFSGYNEYNHPGLIQEWYHLHSLDPDQLPEFEGENADYYNKYFEKWKKINNHQKDDPPYDPKNWVLRQAIDSCGPFSIFNLIFHTELWNCFSTDNVMRKLIGSFLPKLDPNRYDGEMNFNPNEYLEKYTKIAQAMTPRQPIRLMFPDRVFHVSYGIPLLMLFLSMNCNCDMTFTANNSLDGKRNRQRNITKDVIGKQAPPSPQYKCDAYYTTTRSDKGTSLTKVLEMMKNTTKFVGGIVHFKTGMTLDSDTPNHFCAVIPSGKNTITIIDPYEHEMYYSEIEFFNKNRMFYTEDADSQAFAIITKV